MRHLINIIPSFVGGYNLGPNCTATYFLTLKGQYELEICNQIIFAYILIILNCGRIN